MFALNIISNTICFRVGLMLARFAVLIKRFDFDKLGHGSTRPTEWVKQTKPVCWAGHLNSPEQNGTRQEEIRMKTQCLFFHSDKKLQKQGPGLKQKKRKILWPGGSAGGGSSCAPKACGSDPRSGCVRR